jgi:hypothetical protein
VRRTDHGLPSVDAKVVHLPEAALLARRQRRRVGQRGVRMEVQREALEDSPHPAAVIS